MLDYGVRAIEKMGRAMSKGKIAALLLTILVLNLSTSACAGITSQGPLEQQRPAENQMPATEELTAKKSREFAEHQEKTAREERLMREKTEQTPQGQ
ncbi:MAG: hypothetical protein M3315_14260 [Actinomycetota bacterium]|jgi:hypothetical protein|nr:hypothetical protein [Actinomycetota bacterium]